MKDIIILHGIKLYFSLFIKLNQVDYYYDQYRLEYCSNDIIYVFSLTFWSYLYYYEIILNLSEMFYQIFILSVCISVYMLFNFVILFVLYPNLIFVIIYFVLSYSSTSLFLLS